jgi:hypothetical protein
MRRGLGSKSGLLPKRSELAETPPPPSSVFGEDNRLHAKAAVRDTQRTMPEESTTPDPVELMRKVENLLGLHPELLVNALPVFQESANRRATLKRTHPQRRHVPNSVTGKEAEHRASLDENGIQLTNYTDIAEARSAAERLAGERG